MNAQKYLRVILNYNNSNGDLAWSNTMELKYGYMTDKSSNSGFACYIN